MNGVVPDLDSVRPLGTVQCMIIPVNVEQCNIDFQSTPAREWIGSSKRTDAVVGNGCHSHLLGCQGDGIYFIAGHNRTFSHIANLTYLNGMSWSHLRHSLLSKPLYNAKLTSQHHLVTHLRATTYDGSSCPKKHSGSVSLFCIRLRRDCRILMNWPSQCRTNGM
jgi:hypothetical protein